MDIIDKIGKSISDTGREIAYGAKSYNEIVNYNTQMFGFQDVIDKKTEEIGKLYVEKYLNDEQADFQPQLTEIRNAKSKIDELEAKIKEIKTRGTCPKCGAAVGVNDAFCVNCGGNLAELRAQAAKDPNKVNATLTRIFCTHCGAPNDGDARFCVQCGKQLITPRPVYVAAPEPAKTETAASAAAPGEAASASAAGAAAAAAVFEEAKEPKLEMPETPPFEPAPDPELVYQATPIDLDQPAPELVYQASEDIEGPEAPELTMTPPVMTADPIVTPHFEEPSVELPKVDEVDWKVAMAERDEGVPVPEMPEAPSVIELPTAAAEEAVAEEAPSVIELPTAAAEEAAEAVAEEATAVAEEAVEAAEEAAEAVAEPVEEAVEAAPEPAEAAEPAVEAAETAEPVAEEPKEAPVPGFWFCTECGNKNEEGYLFCTQCGKKRS